MKINSLPLILSLVFVTFQSCSDDDDSSTSTNNGSTNQTADGTPTSAFDEFDTDNITITFNDADGTITLESNGMQSSVLLLGYNKSAL